MADEISLPHMPSVSWNPETQTFNNTRKRARYHEPGPPLFNNSSDPAVFSSDDDPNVDNYTQGKHKKKRYVGSWFQQHPASSDSVFSEEQRPLPGKNKRTLKRQLDSGVWMGSDESIDLDDDSVFESVAPASSKLPQLNAVPAQPSVSRDDENVRHVVEKAIDEGIESIDLSDMKLQQVSNATLAQLSEFSCIPLVAEDVAFEQRDPSLKLYLFNNPLQRAPGAIFNLEHLTVLSLRNTQIAELPPTIRNLRNLKELNVSLSRLGYLPGELLDLIKYPSNLEKLNLHPNPFWRPASLQNAPDDPIARSGRHDSLKAAIAQAEISGTRSWYAAIEARSPVQFSDSRGVLDSKFRLPEWPRADGGPIPVLPCEDLASEPTYPPARYGGGGVAQQAASATTSSVTSRVPSLLELALQSCSTTSQLRELPSYLPPWAPSHLPRLLCQVMDQSEANDNSGAFPCSICGRHVQVPTTQWIEWWEISQVSKDSTGRTVVDPVGSNNEERAIPFLMRGCSWACVPQTKQAGEVLPGIAG